MSIFAKVFGYLLGMIFQFVQDYGISIILFTLITKLILMPFTIKQIKSSKEMSALQPKIKEIQDKYKGNQEKQNQLLMELYKEHNYNPLSGCLPLLIQFPIIIGLFTALRQPETYVFVNNPELLARATQDFFLWVPNLSQPDLLKNVIPNGPEWLVTLPGLLPITSAVLTYFQMKSMNAAQTTSNAAQNTQLKVMQTIFPVMILLWGKTMSAGLILYWTIGNIFQIGQQYFMNRQTKGEA
ncbi:YidC/Oxa1 family membrane protein insertase [Fusibacter paucivorans]|uniref:YidC/Oxa1 family membrane protein insertase n=1 Tax=Fusibacter paucivorans TaxID=76009 RepID=A0ABS5PNM9_9FIRM|nr:YidC/Oxa1 family membrane protein insertase [Fusibacter paucivorans]MBS7526527.1 YidC/Oxa1 family membrane protein insertase [Fusibacter paucivorans]